MDTLYLPHCHRHLSRCVKWWGAARKVCDIRPMKRARCHSIKRGTGLMVFAPGEAGAITTSDKQFEQIELINKKRAIASYISQELSDDSLINVVDNVVTEMGYGLALQEDAELVNGTGAGAVYFGVTGLLASIGRRVWFRRRVGIYLARARHRRHDGCLQQAT